MSACVITIDIGGTCAKILIKDTVGSIRKYILPAHNVKEVLAYIHKYIDTETYIYLTGGGAKNLKKHLNHEKTYLINEFDALYTGSQYFLQQQKNAPLEYILVVIGTGTSIHYVKNGVGTHIGGTGIGGGSLLGLGNALIHKIDGAEINALALQGNVQRVNITVADIYMGATPPMDGSYTASNFGKLGNRMNNATDADKATGLVTMVAEVIYALASSCSTTYQTKHIVYCGGALETFSSLGTLLSTFYTAQNDVGYFLPEPLWIGAWGCSLK